MQQFSKDKDINKLVRSLIHVGWRYQFCKKHRAIVSPMGKKLFIPGTPSDRRAFYNFRRDVQYVIAGDRSHAA
jgi:hypothetical protein